MPTPLERRQMRQLAANSARDRVLLVWFWDIAIPRSEGRKWQKSEAPGPRRLQPLRQASARPAPTESSPSPREAVSEGATPAGTGAEALLLIMFRMVIIMMITCHKRQYDRLIHCMVTPHNPRRRATKPTRPPLNLLAPRQFGRGSVRCCTQKLHSLETHCDQKLK